MTTLKNEARSILGLALPVIVAQVGLMMLGVVDNLMLGNFDLAEFNASALGRLWVVGTLYAGMGFVFGIDPLISHAHGAGDSRGARLALERGLVIALALSLPIGAAWFFTEEVLVATGQSAEFARIAERYALAQLPGLPAWLVFSALRTYLQGRGVMKPAMVVALAANVLNAFGNWVLIYGELGAPRLGALGAGIATGVTEIAMAVALWVLVARWHRGRGERLTWSREAFALRGFVEIAKQGAPVALMLGLEIWAFHVANLFAGRIGATELAAHTIVINLASLSFMVPLGISMGTATRVGNLIGAADNVGAQRAAWAGFALGALTMSFFAITFFVGRDVLPALYTAELDVRALGAAILPIGAAFQVFDGLQVVGCGILRGMGRPRPAAAFNLIGYWAFALPIGWWLGFRGGHGLAGLWWGLSIGLALVALSCIAWVARRGPLHAVSLASRSSSSH
ncbi:MAG: MATE family efflux transporter [Planctomycetes bacterium]|nr:MATE family efflux transporter [Planctomycetota bacterium]